MTTGKDRIRGAVLGAAIGDAMGHATEFIKSFAAIREKFGPDGVTKYERYWTRGEKRFAPYTDDTQMAEATLRALLWGRAHDADLDLSMRYLARLYVLWAYQPLGGHRAPGNACMAGCRMLATGTPWYEAGGEEAGGCGSVMRVFPFGLMFADDLARCEAWAVEHSKLTHRAPIAFAACAAMALGTAAVLRGRSPSEVVQVMTEAAARHDLSTAEMIVRARDEALAGVAPEVTLQRLLGWAAHEAIAAAVYVFLRHADDFRAAVLEASNTPGDSDSIATLVGALVGARVGFAALPAAWFSDLERHDELLMLADDAWSACESR